MYHPYFRGKQYELITIREMAPVMKRAGFRPIIEPVKEGLGGLQKTLKVITDLGSEAIVVVNPHYGDHSVDASAITSLLKNEFQGESGISAGILLKPDTTAENARTLYGEHEGHKPVFIHAGFSDVRGLSRILGNPNDRHCHVFFERLCGKLYLSQFKGARRILLKDGFERKRNADYCLIERFSDLHVIFEDENMDGFGDFLIVGDDYSESGGPAYAVAIHLTFIDSDQFDEMWIYHFVSTTQDTPKDPAGKFAEALSKMVQVANEPKSKLMQTSAVQEFESLHNQGHFPGLGYVKKLSMNHHIETLAHYFANRS